MQNQNLIDLELIATKGFSAVIYTPAKSNEGKVWKLPNYTSFRMCQKNDEINYHSIVQHEIVWVFSMQKKHALSHAKIWAKTIIMGMCKN